MNIKLILIKWFLWATGWTAEEIGLDSRRGQRFFSSPQRPYQFWGPPSLLYIWYGGALSPGVKLSGLETHLHQVLRVRVVELNLHFPITSHGMVRN
jgi:hypothetical protein